jgi:uncharacterized protein
MDEYEHHLTTSCLDHSMGVAYGSFLVAKRLGMDARAVARGGLLHDFFLYDWREKGSHKGLHGFSHPRAAMENAIKYFDVTPLEQQIILCHMFPMGRHVPRTRESLTVCLMDKLCALCECTGLNMLLGLARRVAEILETQPAYSVSPR